MYEPICHYRRFDDEVGAECPTLEEAQAVAIEMRDARDPVHADRSDMGASVWERQGEMLRCVWTEGRCRNDPTMSQT